MAGARVVARTQHGEQSKQHGSADHANDDGHGFVSSRYASINGCQRAIALLMIRITARDEIVAPVIITTSVGAVFPRSFFTPVTGAPAFTKPFTNVLSVSILLPSPGVSLLPMTFMAISLCAV